MKRYTVTITEVLKKNIVVEAQSPEFALQMVREGFEKGEYPFTSKDSFETAFKIEYPPLRRDRDSR